MSNLIFFAVLAVFVGLFNRKAGMSSIISQVGVSWSAVLFHMAGMQMWENYRSTLIDNEKAGKLEALQQQVTERDMYIEALRESMEARQQNMEDKDQMMMHTSISGGCEVEDNDQMMIHTSVKNSSNTPGSGPVYEPIVRK